VTARARQRGLTLIEMLIVIGVIALMVGMAMMSFASTRNAETSRAVTQIANTMRYGFDKARVNGEYYRLLIDLDENRVFLQAGDDKMYLPATDRDGKVIEFDERKAEDRATRDARAADSYNRSLQSQVFDGRTKLVGEQGEPINKVQEGAAAGGDAADDADEADPYKPKPKQVPRQKPPLFSRFESEDAITGLDKGVPLPEGVRINYVRTADDLEPIIKGQASIYFFPGGRTQLAHIQVEDESRENRYTIKIQPLTGRVTIVDGHEDLVLPDDADDEEDELGRRSERRTF